MNEERRKGPEGLFRTACADDSPAEADIHAAGRRSTVMEESYGIIGTMETDGLF